MNQLIVCLTKDDTGDREDCNVDYYLITSDTLTFSESLFDDKLEVHKKSRRSWLTAVRALGYTVHDIEQRVIVLSRV